MSADKVRTQGRRPAHAPEHLGGTMIGLYDRHQGGRPAKAATTMLCEVLT